MLGIDKVVKFLMSEKLQVVVEAPPEVAFSYLEDISRHDGWLPYRSVMKTSEGPVGAGSTFTTFSNLGLTPSGTKTMLEVTEFLPNQLANNRPPIVHAAGEERPALDQRKPSS